MSYVGGYAGGVGGGSYGTDGGTTYVGSGSHVTGGSSYANSYAHSSGTEYAGGYGGDLDHAGAEHHAFEHSGDTDRSLFSNALGMLSGKKEQLQNEDVDEEDMVKQHKSLYGGEGSGGQVRSLRYERQLGLAANCTSTL